MGARGKFAKVFCLCFLALCNGGVLVCEPTQFFLLPIHANVGNPVFAGYMPEHSGMARFVVSEPTPVDALLASGGNSEIFSPVVESVSVLMVYASRDSHDDQMHGFSTVGSVGVEGLRAFVPNCDPVPLHQPVVIGSIDNGDLAPSKRDVSDRLVLRLNNRLSRNSIFRGSFGHDPTSNRIAAVQPHFHFIRNLGGYPNN